MEDRLLPLKQTVRHPLDPPLPLHVDVVGPVHHHLASRRAVVSFRLRPSWRRKSNVPLWTHSSTRSSKPVTCSEGAARPSGEAGSDTRRSGIHHRYMNARRARFDYEDCDFLDEPDRPRNGHAGAAPHPASTKAVYAPRQPGSAAATRSTGRPSARFHCMDSRSLPSAWARKDESYPGRSFTKWMCANPRG